MEVKFYFYVGYAGTSPAAEQYTTETSLHNYREEKKKNETEENHLIVIGRFASTVIVIENDHSRWERVYS